MKNTPGPIGIFDSGYGGLTIFKDILRELPDYDYVYLGDNARNPYGSRSFETVYRFTWECVQQLFDKGCRLVILACNTASAKALRNIQQLDLPSLKGLHKVLGVIRPTAEVIGQFSNSRTIGILATQGTVASESYLLEIEKFFPDLKVYQEACPMWVPIVEVNVQDSEGATYFIKHHLDQIMAKSDQIDALLLACTHYPLLMDQIKEIVPAHIKIISQGGIVAKSLVSYLERHPEVDALCSKGGKQTFFTTELPSTFDSKASLFFGQDVQAKQLMI